MKITKFSNIGEDSSIIVSDTLILNVDAIDPRHLVNKISVDDQFTNKVLALGDTISLPILLTNAPTQEFDSVRKIDVDNRAIEADTSPNKLTIPDIDNALTSKINKAAPTSTGFIQLNQTYTNNNSLSTKEYIDNLNIPTTTTGENVKIGTIIEYGSSTPPNSFLRCNGAILQKSLFPDLYNQIGDIYSDVNIGNGLPFYQQYMFNNETNNLNVALINGTNLAKANSWGHLITTSTRVYLVGGGNASSPNISSRIQYAPINADGSIGSWTLTFDYLPYGVAGAACVQTKDYAYIIGGCNYYQDNYNTTFTNKIIRCNINTDGTIGSFTQLSTTLPVNLAGHCAVIIKNYIYVFGGASTYPASNFTGKNTVYRATINNDGSLTSFTEVSQIPYAVIRCKPAVVGNYIYLIAGQQDYYITNTKYCRCYINEDGSLGSWEVIGDFPNPMSRIACAVTNKQVIVFGGMRDNNFTSTANYYNKFYVANIQPNGDLSVFTPMDLSSLNSNNLYGWITDLYITSSRLYLIGGQLTNSVNLANGNFPISTPYTYYIPFNGGSNNYINLINNYNQNPTTFLLPNFSNREAENPGLYYYIKATNL